ncbi:hypothetical protein EJB05_26470, partial [Eragrostis curvula]
MIALQKATFARSLLREGVQGERLVIDPMAGSSRMCSDKDLQKAQADLEDLVSRCPIPDEFKFPGGDEEEEDSNKKDDKKEEQKKGKLSKMRREDVDMLLSYQCPQLPEYKGLAKLEEENKDMYKDLRNLATMSQAFLAHYQEGILAAQEIVRDELKTKGYVTYKATDGEAGEEESTASRGPRGGGGRRRHRPGVNQAPVFFVWLH